MITTSCHNINQGRMPPLVGHHRQPGGTLPCASASLGFLVCCDAGLCFFY
jgi:hypothetical protein